MIPATINIFEKAARKAGKILVRDFGEIENLQIQSKSVGDFVTSADLKVEKSLLETLQYYYPKANFITEESGSIKGEGETIVIDPIDGTSNFIHGLPHVSIVIGKIINEEITDGIIFNPVMNEFYWASKGKGAWCNNKRIRVSKRQDLSNCLIGTGAPFGKRIYENYYNELKNISKLTSGVRRLGSASLDLAYVASGKIDGYWEKDLNLWDVCSGVLLVKEAGGRLTEPNGNNWTTKSRDILVSNTLIHDKLIKNLTLL
ncbi:inositol monophosphatase family protein [Alphaproteobacteria bacterium]|nr:inositol monophosphatase family protein [Alphaproteobacteria bacterium]